MSAPPIPPYVQDWLASLLETTAEHAVIFVAPDDGTVLAWLGAAERLLGYSAQEAIGMKLERLFTPEDLQLGLEKQERALAIADGRSEDDRWHVRKNGSRFWASGVLEAVRAADGSIVALCKVFRDKTDFQTRLRTLEHRIARSPRTHAPHDEDAFVKAGHEMANVLAPMQNALGVLDKSDEPSVRKRACAILQRQIDVLTAVTEELTAKGKSRPPMTLEPLVLQDALRQTIADWSDTARERRLLLQSVLPDVALLVEADPARLRQILANLVGNAIKYTPAGGRVTISASAEAHMALVRVEDDGIGIAPDKLPYVFELFSRGVSAGPEGLGVGLAVVKELVEWHSGSISARSAGPGKGSVFTLQLPLSSQAHPGRARCIGP